MDITFTVIEWGSREWGSRDSMKPAFRFSIFSFITLFVQVEAGWPNRRSFLEWLRRLTPVITQESCFTSKYSWPVPLIRAGRDSDIVVSLIAQAHQVGPDESWCLSNGWSPLLSPASLLPWVSPLCSDMEHYPYRRKWLCYILMQLNSIPH